MNEINYKLTKQTKSNMKKRFTFLIAALGLLMTFLATPQAVWGQSSYTKVTTDIADWSGTYVIVADGSGKIFTGKSGSNNYGGHADVTISDNTVTGSYTDYEVEIAKSGDKYTIKHKKNSQYLGWTSGNSLSFSTDEPSSNQYKWELSLSAILNANDNSRKLQYNSVNPRFACYTSNQKEAYLYKKCPTQLSDPTNLAAEAGNAQATFTWDAVSNASSYTLSYTTDPEWGSKTDVTDITETSKTVTELTNETTYYAKVMAVGDGDSYSNSNYSSFESVTPTDATFYDITITSPPTGGSVEASAPTATAGSEITLTATPSAGYTFSNITSNWSVVDEGDNPVTVTTGEGYTATFTMPASDVTVGATFTALPKYTITKNASNGTIETDATNDEAYEGQVVTLTLTPNDGYILSTLSVVDADQAAVAVTDNHFTMPGKVVTVTAVFIQAVTDVLTRATTGVSGTSYTNWSDKTVTSGAVYAGNSAGGNGAIQLRSSDNSGIITTTSGGKLNKVVVAWNSNTASGRTLDIYGKNTAYTDASELYSGGSQGTKLGSIVKGTSTELVISGDYKYIGLRSNNGAMYLNQISITWQPAAVAIPTFSPVAGNYVGTQNVTLSCATDGATIYYTTDGTTPTDASTAYTGAISVTSTTTIKAIAIKDAESSDVASATYTIVTPLTTMDAIYDKAVEVGSTETGVYIIFNDWIISGSSGSNQAFLTDGTKGCLIYESKHGFSAGHTLSGTVQCNVMLYNGAAEITGLTSKTEGLNVSSGGSVIPMMTTIGSLTAVNTGSLVTIKDLTYSTSTSTLSDGINSITPYNTIYEASFTNGKKYDVTGVFAYNTDATGNKRINPRSDEDVVLKADMSYTDFSGLAQFTYLEDNGPSAAQHFEIYGSDFADDMTITASGDYEVSTDNITYSASVVAVQDAGVIDKDLYVRLKSGLSEGDHNGTLTFTATNLTTLVQNLVGTVTTTPTYAITLNQISGGTISADKLIAEAGETVTLSVDLDDCYNFSGWTVLKDDLDTPVSVTDNQFVMPDCEVLVSATFTQKTFTVSYSVNGVVEDDLEESVTCGNNATLHDADDLAAVSVSIPAGYNLAGWSTSASSTETVNSLTPSGNTTLYAVFVYGSLSYNLVTSASEITAGKYLIGAFRSTVAPSPLAYYIADGTINSDGDMVVTESSYSTTNNQYSSLPGGVEFTMTGNNTDGFAISIGSKYLGYTSYANRNLVFGDYSSYLWKFYNKDGGLSTGAVYMQCNYNNKKYTVSENSTGTGAIRGYANETAYRGFYLFKKTEPISFTLVTEVTSTQTRSVAIPAYERVVVSNNAVLTLNAANNGTAANLIIEDGGQLITSSSNVPATVQKSIAGAGTETTATGWYLISSPIANAVISGGTPTVSNLITSSGYDLFRYNESDNSWQNYKVTQFTSFENGRGYLYRNAEDQTVTFTGNINISATYNLSYSNVIDNVEGLNIIGNPFTYDVDWNNITKKNVITLGYYTLETNGGWTPNTSGTIAPMQGILVKAEGDNPSVTFGAAQPAKETAANNDYIKFVVSNSQYEDVTYALFDKGEGLNKINHRNAEIPMLYIPQDGENYAIATMGDDTQMFGLSFKAKTMGKYTLSYNTKGEFSYLHVIDRLTGEDVDMLLDGEYSFMGSSSDADDRFVVKLSYSANVVENSSAIFAYQNGTDIIVEGDGELQVFDLMGRHIMNTNVNGTKTISTSTLNRGVYVMRLDGKVQKIVVR